MTNWNGFVGAHRPLNEAEIAQAAVSIKVPYARLRGIMQVEASYRHPGQGFDTEHRPKMLFEPQHFYRNIHDDDVRLQAVHAGLAMADRPPAHWYGNKSYDRLLQAVDLDETAALVSCSWGLGQVLGASYRAGGWKSVQEMVLACMDDENAQLHAMVGFIVANHLVDELQRGDAAGFARVYNGPGYARDNYNGKISTAWAQWASQPVPALPAPVAKVETVVEVPPAPPVVVSSVPLAPSDPLNEAFNSVEQTITGGIITGGTSAPAATPATTPTIPTRTAEPPLGTSEVVPSNAPTPVVLDAADVVVAKFDTHHRVELVAQLQRKLTDLNYACGSADGLFGRLLRDALMSYEANNNLPIRTDVLESKTFNAIMTAGVPKPLSPDRTLATPKSPELRASTIMRSSLWMKKAVGWVGGLFGLTTLTDPNPDPTAVAREMYEKHDDIHAQLDYVRSLLYQGFHSTIFIAVLLFVVFGYTAYIIQQRLIQHQRGLNLGN